MSENPIWIIVGTFMALMVMFGAAFYFEQRQTETSTSPAAQKPVKKFRAKPGTERENARALVSSQPSVSEEKTKEDIDVWGSLEKDEASPKTTTESVVSAAFSSGSPEEGARLLLEELRTPGEIKQPGLIYASLAAMYWSMDPPMTEEAEKALALAWSTATTPMGKLEATYAQASYDLSKGDIESMMKTLDRLSDLDVPLTSHTLELGVMLGIGYESLGMMDEARIAYESVMKDAEDVDITKHRAAADVYRQAGLRLAAWHRTQGDPREAKTVALTVQRMLDF